MRSEFVTIMDVPGSSTVATIKTPNNTAMNLRNGPGSGYGVVRQFPGDRYVMVLAKGNGWWRVSIDGYTGFMSKDFLVEGLHSAKDNAAQNGGGAVGTSYAVVANPKSTQALNLRAFASTGAGVLDKLYNGAKLWVDEQGTEWSAVTVQNTGRVRLCHDPLPEALQPALHAQAHRLPPQRHLCEPALGAGYDPFQHPDPRTHGQERYDRVARTGLVQGAV